jgi:hypothetical protein
LGAGIGGHEDIVVETGGTGPGSFDIDYLVVGAGGMGMAFADSILTATTRTLAIVDRYHQPGGHWTLDYPFVRLHQASSVYGVNSRRLGSGVIDRVGWNRGLPELASGAEVCAYYDQVMQQDFLPSGRVRYLPMSEYLGAGHVGSLVTGRECTIDARRVVDATYMDIEVPAMRAPPFAVADGATCVAPNALVRLRGQHDRFVVIGAGKTGMDSCLWLLGHDVEPSAITWVRPRDAWLSNRGFALAQGISGAQALLGQVGALADAQSFDDAFERLQHHGRLLRLDPAVTPTMYRSASVTPAELAQLRRITAVVRLGHVREIHADRLELAGGTVPATPTTLHVDCSADGLKRRPSTPIFGGRTLTLQSVRMSQQVFSAALLGQIEAMSDDDAEKNALARPVPHPDVPLDFFRATLDGYRNLLRWQEVPSLHAWLAASRLNGRRSL